MRVLVLRAPHQARETARRLSLLGHEAISAPVWSFRRAGQPEEVLQKLAEFPRKTDSALILTSANAVRALNAYGLDGKNAYMSDNQNTGDSGERDIYSPNDQNTRNSGNQDAYSPDDQNAYKADSENAYRLKEGLCRLPVYAVGAETAAAAQKFGFETICTADGNGASLAETVRLKHAFSSPLLHLRGVHASPEPAKSLLAGGYNLQSLILYEMKAAEYLPRGARAVLRAAPKMARRGGAGAGVVLPSARTARLFASLVRASGHEPRCTHILGLARSPAVADTARTLLPWQMEILSL